MDYVQILRRSWNRLSNIFPIRINLITHTKIVYLDKIKWLEPLAKKRKIPYEKFEIEERQWTSNTLMGIREGEKTKHFIMTFTGIPKKVADELIIELKNFYEAQRTYK